MTLVNMALLICKELGLYDDTSLSMCKVFLSKQYTTLWEKYPWGDANGYGTASVTAGVSVIDYPVGMDRIITLRATTGPYVTPPSETPEEPDDPTVVSPVVSSSWFLDPVDSTFLIESEPHIYEERGIIKYYEEIGDASGRQIRLYPIPTWGTKLTFYGKMEPSAFSADTDEPTLWNITAVLLAYGMFDMLQRQRQYAKADAKRKEALELEQQTWALEQQQANQPRRTKATTIAGNSLAEMVDAVCQICGQWAPEYRQIIREFIRRNYQTMYDTFLWPESLVMVRVPYSTEQVIMPHYIDKVLGIRGGNNERMFPADAVLFLDITPAIFDEIGEPIGYTTLTPVAVASLPEVTTKLVFTSTSAVDRTPVYVRGEVLSTGIILEEEISLNGTTPVQTRNSYDIPITCAKDKTLGDVTINALSNYALLQTLPANVRELKHQRCWFLPAPNADTGFGSGLDHATCLVLAKRAIRPLVTDQDTPIITGAQQVLIASAAGDLFTKLEKGDMATRLIQKAEGSMNVLKAKNTDQAASAPRFVPQIEPRAYVSGGVGGCSW